MNSNNNSILSSFSAFYCGLAYIVGIVYFAGITNYININSINEKLVLMAQYQISMYLVNLIIYVIFGIMIAILSLSIYELNKKSLFNKLGLIFGLFWSFAVIISGMIFNIGMQSVLDIYKSDTQTAIISWSIIEIISNSIGGGTEILGGIWILIISIICLKNNILNKYVNMLGLVIGVSALLSDIPGLEIFQMVFGLLQIAWFFALGFSFLKIKNLY